MEFPSKAISVPPLKRVSSHHSEQNTTEGSLGVVIRTVLHFMLRLQQQQRRTRISIAMMEWEPIGNTGHTKDMERTM
jgi:hypothetical protein